MALEILIRGLEGVGEGLVSSYISGGMDIKHARKGGEEFADVVVTTGVITGVCVVASIYLAIPPYIPVAISVMVRAGNLADKLYRKIKGDDIT